MERKKYVKQALADAAMQMVFLLIAAACFWMHKTVWGALLLLIAWVYGCLCLFVDGNNYGVEAAFRDADEMIERVRTLLKSIAEQGKAEAESPVYEGEKCPECGCQIYTETAKRRVCACCGAVLDEGKTGKMP